MCVRVVNDAWLDFCIDRGDVNSGVRWRRGCFGCGESCCCWVDGQSLGVTGRVLEKVGRRVEWMEMEAVPISEMQ